MSANGYFEAYINTRAYRRSSADRALARTLQEVAAAHLPGAQVRWAGSQAKRTAVDSSDLDFCIETRWPVDSKQRNALRRGLQDALRTNCTIRSHAIRIAPVAGRRADIAFAHAEFGSRPLPDLEPFKDAKGRQMACRAFKLWTSENPLPHVPGWAAETLVLALDGNRTTEPLALFLRVINWLAERANPAALESFLRPGAFPRWNEQWSSRLPGRLESLRNGARALQTRAPAPAAWKSASDVEDWLVPGRGGQ